MIPGSTQQPRGRIAVWTAVAGTVFIAAAAFWLSFTALADLARRSGVDESQAWAWPLIVDGIIVVANVDPHSARETTVSLDLEALGLPPGSTFEVKDLLSGERYTWGTENYVRLDAFVHPVHIFRIDYPKGV